MTGTSTDKGGNWAGWGLPGQMDCIDESTNTTIYLRMLQKDGLLRWHQAGDRATRWTPFTWPHTTAVIEERDSLLRWAVDSWFLDNAANRRLRCRCRHGAMAGNRTIKAQAAA